MKGSGLAQKLKRRRLAARGVVTGQPPGTIKAAVKPPARPVGGRLGAWRASSLDPATGLARFQPGQRVGLFNPQG